MSLPSEQKYLESQGVDPSANYSGPESYSSTSSSEPPPPPPTSAAQNSGMNNQVAPLHPPPQLEGQRSAPEQQVCYLKPVQDKNLCEGYLLLGLLGFFGAHHFYLRRHKWGVFYLFTLGGLGCGYLFDFFRLPCLVKRANDKIMSQRAGQWHEELERDLHADDAYVLWFPPWGFLGLHHFYLNRPGWGLLYLCTFGCFGLGWILDGFRLSFLVQDFNSKIGKPIINDKKRRLDDAYVTWFPFCGLLGFHHFYLNRPCWGVLYIFTLGLFGVGWLIDLFRLPSLVKRFNQDIEDEIIRGQTVVTITSATQTYDNHVGQQHLPVGPVTGYAQYPAQYPAYPAPQHNYDTSPPSEGYAYGPADPSLLTIQNPHGPVMPPPYSLNDPASVHSSMEAQQNVINEK